jgi:hypothetical protein
MLQRVIELYGGPGLVYPGHAIRTRLHDPELVVVIGIIGIISGFAPVFMESNARRDLWTGRNKSARRWSARLKAITGTRRIASCSIAREPMSASLILTATGH